MTLRSRDDLEAADLLEVPTKWSCEDECDLLAASEEHILVRSLALLGERWAQVRRPERSRRAREFFIAFDFLTHDKLAILWELVAGRAPGTDRTSLLGELRAKASIEDTDEPEERELHVFLDRVLDRFAVNSSLSGSLSSLRHAMKVRLGHRAEYKVRENKRVKKWKVPSGDLIGVGRWVSSLLSDFGPPDAKGVFYSFADGQLWIENDLPSGSVTCRGLMNCAPDGVFFFGFAELTLAGWEAIDCEEAVVNAKEMTFWESMSRLFVALEPVYLARYQPDERRDENYSFEPTRHGIGISAKEVAKVAASFEGLCELLEAHTVNIAEALWDQFAITTRPVPSNRHRS